MIEDLISNNMVRLRMSRSLGVLVSLFLETRPSPVEMATYCLPPASNVVGRMPLPRLILPKLIEGDVER